MLCVNLYILKSFVDKLMKDLELNYLNAWKKKVYQYITKTKISNIYKWLKQSKKV